MKTVALFGGSFNPPHLGHFEMARYIYETLGVDEVWLLFSTNWQKDSNQYASVEHRMAMGRILVEQYPDIPFVLSDIQDKLGTHITHEVLTMLTEKNPDTRFVWTMGADNLESFHTWENFEKIIENFPIAVVDRPPYTEKAQQSYAALAYAYLQKSSPEDLVRNKNGWCFLDNPQIDISSSDLRIQFQKSQFQFERRFQKVANYIVEQGLYGTKRPDQTPDLTTCSP